MFSSDDTYRKLYEGVNDAIFILNSDGVFVDCNLAAQKILALKKDQILGLTPAHLSPKFQPNGALSEQRIMELNHAALQGRDQAFEWVFMRNGQDFHSDVSISIVTDRDVTFIYGIVKDLTEIREREAQLKSSEERFRVIFNQSADGVLIYQPSSGFIDCNASALELLAVNNKNDLMGLHPWEISREQLPDGYDSREKVIEMNRKCLDEGQNRLEWIFIRQGRKVWYDVVLTRVDLHDETFIHVILRNITDKKKNEESLLKYQDHLEELVKDRTLELELNEEELLLQHEQLESALKELRDTQDQLILSEKMASLGILSAGIGHEINNPLNYIKGGIEGLSTYLDSKQKIKDPVVKKYIKIIQEGASRVSSIVNSLSHYSRSGQAMDEKCDIYAILENCLTILSSRILHRIKLTKQFDKRGLIILGNSGRLHQAFLNILSNAEQAIHDSGNITLKVCNEEDTVKVKITDDGIGIEKEDLSRIMDPFFTTKSPGNGTGLGLAITYKIIEEHLGKIDVTSNTGKGTTFVVTLPKSS